MGKGGAGCDQGAPSNQVGHPVLGRPGTPLYPTTTPKKRHRECTVLPSRHQGCAWILPGQL